MAFSWLSRWLNRTSQPARRRRSLPCPQLEELEPRWVPANYYLVRGPANTLTSLTFQLTARQSNFHDEIGVYVLPSSIANDDLGTIDNGSTTTTLQPTDPGYANAVLTETAATAGTTVGSGMLATVFSQTQAVGQTTTLTFNAGSLLGFYLVQNGTAAAAAAEDPQNAVNNSEDGPVVFFSFNGANPDNFNHTESTLYGDGSAQFNWNDQTGGGFPVSFNNMVFTVGVDDGSAVSVTAGPNQVVPATFTLNGRNSNSDELGLYAVNQPSGQITSGSTTLNPGDPGYVQAALSSASQQVIFTGSQAAGATTTVNLPGGGLYALYLVQNGTTASVLADNPTDQAGLTPQVYFAFVEGNPDQIQHLLWQNTSTFTWDDQAGGGNGHFDALTATVTLGTPSPSQFVVSAPTSTTAGTAFNFTVTAENANNTPVTNYSGTVHFTSSDTTATLPADTTLTNGTGTFSATLTTAGAQTLTATDTANSSLVGTSAPITVIPAHFVVSAPASATAGAPINFTVTAEDANNNPITNFSDTIHFTSSDTAAVLPANATLTNGTGTFSATLKTAGPQTITVADTVNSGLTGTSGTITVGAAATSQFAVSAPASALLASPVTFTVTAEDAFNNTTTSYSGTVHFTSTDTAAVLPANTTLTNGTGSFSATFNTAGSQTLTATDTVTSSITGTSGTINVTSTTDTPTVTTAIANQSVAQNAAPTVLDLAANFGDPDIVDGNTTVTLTTSSGTITLSLLDKTAPQTVANFVDYVNSGAYNNSIFHRLASLSNSNPVSSSNPAQILQGGGFTLNSNPTTISTIPTAPPIANEFNANDPDVAGTIAMARTSSPNSATDQFFFNLTDNSSTLGASNGGGFAVFGNVTGSSTTTLNTLSQIPTFNESTGTASTNAAFNSAATNLPLSFFTGGNNDPTFPTDTSASNYELINSATVQQKDALTYKVLSNTNPGLVTPTLSNEKLTLTYAANMTGTSTIVVQATNQHGNSITQTFTVTVT